MRSENRIKNHALLELFLLQTPPQTPSRMSLRLLKGTTCLEMGSKGHSNCIGTVVLNEGSLRQTTPVEHLLFYPPLIFEILQLLRCIVAPPLKVLDIHAGCLIRVELSSQEQLIQKVPLQQ